MNLTEQQIADAKNNDLDAVTAVCREAEECVLHYARLGATSSSRVDRDLMDDLAQVGRLAAWQCIERFAGSSVDEFAGFIVSTVRGAISNERASATRSGVSRGVAQEFETALRATSGDPYEAERYAASSAMGKRALSPETAYAARLSWQGLDSLDRPVHNSKDNTGAWLTLGDTIPEEFVTSKDRENARQRAIRVAVHAAMKRLSPRASAILAGTYGIDDGHTPYFGTEFEADFAEFVGVANSKYLQAQRTKAHSRFEVVYLAGETA